VKTRSGILGGAMDRFYEMVKNDRSPLGKLAEQEEITKSLSFRKTYRLTGNN